MFSELGHVGRTLMVGWEPEKGMTKGRVAPPGLRRLKSCCNVPPTVLVRIIQTLNIEA